MRREQAQAADPAAEAGPARRVRTLAVVIVTVFAGWMAANWVGGAIGLPVGLALVIDVLCLGVLGWVLLTVIGIWRARQNEGR